MNDDTPIAAMELLEIDVSAMAQSSDDAGEVSLPTEPETDSSVDPAPDRPDHIPEKFWDAEVGELRTDALLKSYVELERKLGSMIAAPTSEDDIEGHQRLRRVLGVPESPDGYSISPPSDTVAADPAVNARLHDAGFTQAQAQLVYDLAAERLGPLLGEAVAEIEAERETERLAVHFGGAEAWRGLSQQIRTWGTANLSPDVFDALASTSDGIIAMHQMMQAKEPSVLSGSEGKPAPRDQAQLAGMMRDPRYWRDRDPKYIAEITDGFRRLYSS